MQMVFTSSLVSSQMNDIDAHLNLRYRVLVQFSLTTCIMEAGLAVAFNVVPAILSPRGPRWFLQSFVLLRA